jgi:hypothetical protein
MEGMVTSLAADLFVLLHQMLFTNIQFDDFIGILARFLERLEIERKVLRKVNG